MSHKLLALAAAVSLLAASPLGSLLVSGAAMRDDLPAPDWVPDSFSRAMFFLQEYGATHCEEDVACYVQVEYDTPKNKYNLNVSDIGLEGRTDTEPYVWEKTYTFEAPTPPDFSTASTAELDAYYHLCETLGININDDDTNGKFKPPFHISVHAYKIVPGTKLYLNTQTFGEKFNALLSAHTYSFEFDDDGKLTETDIYGWLPDCEWECEIFLQENEGISVHNDYIVYAENLSGRYRMTPSLTGTALVRSVFDDSIANAALVPKDGGADYRLAVYKPVRSGLLRTEFYVTPLDENDKYDFSVSGAHMYGASFEIDNHLHIKPYESEEQIKPCTPGECNGDDKVTVADSITLQNYLSGGESDVPAKT